MLTRICLADPGTVRDPGGAAAAPSPSCRAPADGDGRAVPLRRARRSGDNLLDPDTHHHAPSTSPPGSGPPARYTWLKLPVVDELARVMDATTLPTLLLGGDPQGDPRTPTPRGARRSSCPPCAAWSSGAPCSSRRTATSRRPSTSPPSWSTGRRDDATRHAWFLPARARAAPRTGATWSSTTALDGWQHTGLRVAHPRRRRDPRRRRPAAGSASSSRWPGRLR